MMHDIIKLIPVDESMVFGNRVQEPRYDEAVIVYGEIKSIGENEFYTSAQAGFTLEKRVDLWEADYAGQKRVQVLGSDEEYNVVRNYVNRKTRHVELYLEKVKGRAE